MKLDQFLKFQGIVATGGQAKQLIQNGEVRVNGKIETRRGRKLAIGDQIAIGAHSFILESGVESSNDDL